MARTHETTPLLAGPKARRCSHNVDHVDGVADGPVCDPLDSPFASPLDWSPRFKWGIVALLAYAAFTVTFGCISLAPLATRMVNDLDGARGDGPAASSAAVMLVTIWEVGEAAGPLIIAPLSELFGRRPLFLLANVAFVGATALGAAAPSSALLIVSRALTGAAVAANVLNPAVVGDMFAPAQRGSAMSCIMFAPLIASSLGPAFSSLVDAVLGWRAVLWASVLLAAFGQLMFLACFPETYPVVLARKKAEKGSKGLLTVVLRPFGVFFSSGVLMVLSAYGALTFSYFYIIATTMPTVLEDVYSFEPGMTGSAFLANGFGTLIGVTICRLSLDRIYVRLAAMNPDGAGLPEYRLPLTIVGILTLPGGVALYGWCAEHHLPLPLFLFSVVWIRASMMLAFVPIMPYVVDACGVYAASALTGVIVTRCLTGAFLPLLTAAMVSQLGYGWGFSVLALVTVVFGLIPIALLQYGPSWRQSSKYTQTLHLPGGFTPEDRQV